MGDDDFVDQLAAYDESLRHGTPTEGGESVSPDPRLARAKECVELLNRVWGTSSSCDDSTSPSSAVNQQFESLLNSESVVGDDTSRIDFLSQPIEGGQRFGRFEIIRLLGQGGSGLVFLARDTKLGRQVALKVPRAETLITPELRRRFLLETKAAAALSHSNIVPLYEAGTVGPVCYIASEYCPGPTLAEWLSMGKPVPIRLAAEWVRQLAEAMHHAHQRGVLHRDLKPGNVLLVPQEDSPSATTTVVAAEHSQLDAAQLTPRITDFGLAKLESQEGAATRTGTFLGTVAYMAPEQVEGRTSDCDRRTDVYGLGAILYELLTGRPPFRAATDVATLLAIRQHDLVPPRQLRPTVPADLEAICSTALEKQPDHRYSSAADLAADLRRFLAGEPTIVRPLGRMKRTGRWIRRHQLLSALLAVVAFSIVGFGLGTAWHLTRLKKELATSNLLRQESRQLLYAADMKLASQAVADKDATFAAQLLESHRPRNGVDDRDLEWYLLEQAAVGKHTVIDDVHTSIDDVAISSDATQLATASKDAKVRLYDVRLGKKLSELSTNQRGVAAVAFSEDPNVLATGGYDGTLKIWNRGKLEFSNRLLKDCIRDIIVHPAESTWLACGDDPVIRSWPTASKDVANEYAGNRTSVTALALSPKKSLLASAGRDHTIRIWETRTGSEIEKWQVEFRPLCLTFSPDEDVLAIGFVDGSIDRRIIPQDWKRLPSLPSVGNASCLAYSKDSKFLAVGTALGEIWLWRHPSFKTASSEALRLECVWSAHTDRVNALAFVHNGFELISAGRDGKLIDWPYPEKRSVERLLHFDGAALDSCSFSQRPLVALTTDHEVLVYDVQEEDIKTTLAKDNSNWNLVAIAEPANVIAAANKNHEVRLWQHWEVNPQDSEKLSFDFNIVEISLSPDGRYLVVRPENSKLGIVLHELETGHRRTDLAGPAGGNVCRFSDNSAFLAIGEHDTNDVLLWNVEKHAAKRLKAHRDTISRLAFSPDSSRLASMDDSGTLTLWNCADGTILWSAKSSRNSSKDQSRSLVFTPKGQTLIASFFDTVSFWHVDSGRSMGDINEFTANVKDLSSCDQGRYLCGIRDLRLSVIRTGISQATTSAAR